MAYTRDDIFLFSVIFMITCWLQWIHCLMNENNSDSKVSSEVQQIRIVEKDLL